MEIDISKLLTNLEEEIKINENIEIDKSYFKNTDIRKLDKVHFVGSLIKECDDTFTLKGIIEGIMILPDSITLEDYLHEFRVEIEQNQEILEKTLDIIPILWQNIVVEVPLKVVNEKNKNLKLKGNGWRLVAEDEISESKNLPFDNLKELLDKRKE